MSSSDEKSQDSEDQGPPVPVGFWHPGLAGVRKEIFKKWLLTTVTLMSFILAVLSLYWGAFMHIEKNISTLIVYIVDMDGVAPYNNPAQPPLVGPTITKLGQQMVSSGPHLGFVSVPPQKFGNDPLQVRQAVYDQEAWVAIIINPNATAMLYSAIETGNSSYEPMGACQYVYQDSRDDTTYYDFIFPLMNIFTRQATEMVGQQWAKIALQRATTNATILSNMANAPQALSPAIGFSEYNLRPFYPYTAIPAVSIGLIYLIIISFFSFSFYLPIHVKFLNPQGHPPLKFWQLILWRYLATITAYIFLSLAYSLVSLAFQLNFSSPSHVSEVLPTQTADGNPVKYGHGTFVVYWMLNFFGMIALGLASENVAMLIGMPWMGLWLIFWVITNVVTSFYDIDWLPGFYRWGYAWPLHHIVEGSRMLLFDLHSRIGLNFGVLIAWGAINTMLFVPLAYFMRWKSKHGVHEYWA